MLFRSVGTCKELHDCDMRCKYYIDITPVFLQSHSLISCPQTPLWPLQFTQIKPIKKMML